ncbi:MAG: hypothetical protein GY857_00825 [Desulfobacula sp.]|nr:hypothetical protein [Desulfobacula sp.]
MNIPSNIPWQMDEEWSQVLLSLKAIENKGRLTAILNTAEKIQQKFEIMSKPMEKLCSHTCINCEDICCLRATIWFDFKDLLYIYFATGKFPGSQIKKINLENQIQACSCLTKNGCILPRIERPFVCTWYFCPAQKEYLKHFHPGLLLDFEQILLDIKELRNKIEDEFICLSGII